MNLLDTFSDYLLSQKQQPSRLTVKNYKADVGQFIKWFEEFFQKPFEPKAITVQVLDIYKQEKRKLASSISDRSLERHLSSLRKFFQFLKLEGYMSDNPFELIKQNQKETDPWHVKAFKNHLYVFNAADLTIKNYIIDVKQFLTWAQNVVGGQSDTTDQQTLQKLLRPEMVNTYKDRLINEIGLSPLSINRKLSSLRRYIQWAKQEKFIPEDAYFSFSNTQEVLKKVTLQNLQAQTPKQTETEELVAPTYSSFGPVRLLQRVKKGINFLFDQSVIVPIASIVEKIGSAIWSLQGNPVFKTLKNQTNASSYTPSFDKMILNVKKEFYAPLEISTANFPWYKRLLHTLRYRRPEWYKRYHSNPITHYFHFALLIIVMSSLGFGFYTAFFQAPQQGRQALAAPASPPRTLSFQGRLTDNSDNPITVAATPLRFAIYNDVSATGSALLWQEIVSVSPDTDGIFSVILGNNTVIPQSLFRDNSALWLGVTVQTTPELTPRQPLATVAYATNAEVLQGLPPTTDTAWVAGNTNTNAVLALNASGTIAIGGASTTTLQATSGTFKLTGQALVLQTNSGSAGNITLTPDGLGKIDLQKPLQNTSNNNNISSALGSVEVDDLFSILATSSGQSALTINQNDAGPLISASASGIAKFTVGNSGSITSAAYTNAGGIIYTQTSGLLAQTAAGTSAQCLVGGATPSFASCPSGTTDVFWNQSAGALYPNNSTVDVLIGSQATTSAKFAILNVNSGTPVASVSSGLSGTAAYLTADGTLATQNRMSLTLGNSSTYNTTGNVLINPNGTGNVGIGTTIPGAYKLNVNGNISMNGFTVNHSNGTYSFSYNNVASDNRWNITDTNGTVILRGNGTCATDGIGLGAGNACGSAVFSARVQGSGGSNFLSVGVSNSTTGGVAFGNSSSGNEQQMHVYLDTTSNAANGTFQIWTQRVADSANSPSILLSGNTLKFSTGVNSSARTQRMIIDTNGNVGINTTSPLATLDVRGNLGTGTVASVSGVTSFAALLTDNSGVGDLFTASKSGATKFTILNNGGLQANNFTANGGILYTNGSGVFGQTAAGSSSQCLLGGTTPTFGSCSTGFTDPYWQQTNGALYPNNSTVDFFVGGQATTSAKFAVLNVNTGTPVASISANSGNIASYHTGDGTIGTTNRQSLTIGNSSTYNTTGNVLINSNGQGNVGIGTTNPFATFDLRGNSGTAPAASISATSSFAAAIFDNAGVGDLFTASKSGATKFVVNNAGNVGIGTNLPTGLLHVVSTATSLQTSGLGYFDWSPGSSATSTNDLLTLNVGSNGTLGNIFNIKNAGSSVFSVSQSQFTTSLPANFTSPGDVSIAYDLNFTNPTASYIKSQAPLYITAGETFNSTDLNLSTYNKGNVIVNAEGFLVNGSATVSGQLLSGTTVAPANIGGFYLTNASTYGKALAILNQTESADIFTASASGTPRFVIQNGGNVGIGTILPGTTLDITGTLRNSSTVTFSTFTSNGGVLYTNGSGVLAQATAGTSSQCLLGGTTPTFGSCATGVTDPYWQQASGALFPNNSTVDFFIGGQATTSAKFAVLNVNGSGPATASVSGNLIVYPNNGAGGNIGIGTTAPSTKLHISNGTDTDNGTIALAIGGTVATNNRVGEIVKNTSSPYDLTIYSGMNSAGGTATIFSRGPLASLESMRIDTNGNLGIGTTAPIAKLDVRGSVGTVPTSSISAVSSFAAEIVDNSGVGDLFTASKSGATKFVITNSGNVGIGTNLPAASLQVNSFIGGNDNLILRDTTNGQNARMYFSTPIGSGPDLNINANRVIFPGFAVKMAIIEANGSLDLRGGGTAVSVTGASTITLQTNGNNISVFTGGNGNDTVIRPYTAKNVVIQDASNNPLVTFGGTQTLPTASVSGNTSFAALTVDNANVGDLFTASKSGATKFSVLNNGNVQINNFTSNGGVIYTNASGILAQATAGTNSQCLLGGITPTFGSCSTGFTDPYWQQTSGALFPNNSTVDFFVGGQATTSAKFAVLNVNSGTPVASISSGLSGTAAYLTADGTLGTAKRMALTIGNSATYNTTGDIYMQPNGTGNVAIGTTTNPTQKLQVAGAVKTTSTFTAETASGGLFDYSTGTTRVVSKGVDATTKGAFTVNLQESDGGASLDTLTIDNFGAAQHSLSSGQTADYMFQINNQGTRAFTIGSGTGATYCTYCVYAGSQFFPGQVGPGQQTTKSIVFDNTNTNLLRFHNSASNTKFAFDFSSGNFGIGTNIAQPTAAIQVVGSASISANFSFTGAGTAHTFNIMDNGTLNVQRSPGGDAGLTTQLFLGSNGNIGIGTTNPLATLDVRGNLGTGTAASVSGVTSFAAGLFDNSGVGDLLTASKSGATKFTILNNGGLQANNFTVNGGVLYTNASGVFGQTAVGTASQCLVGGATPSFTTCPSGTDAYWTQANGALYPNNSTVDFLIGGQSSTSAVFKVSPSGTSPSASVSANSSFAALVTDNRGVGDLFTASKSGATKFVITNAGNVGIGTGIPGAFLDISNGDNATVQLSGASKLQFRDTGTFIQESGGLVLQSGAAASGRVLKFKTEATEQARIDTNGNLGIANTIPLAKLDVTGSASLSANEYFRGAGTPHLVNILDNGTLNFQRSPGGDAGLATELFLNNNGNVGIGTTTPLALLDVAGTASASSSLTFRGGAASIVGTQLGDLTIGDSNTSKVILNPSGNIGIGTTVASTKLQVNGAITLGTSAGTNTSTGDIVGVGKLAFGGVDANAGPRIFPSTGLKIQGDTNGIFFINASSANTLFIKNDGNVGIGTAAPLATLDVRGNLGTGTVASVSGVTSFAALLTDNSGVGDLFTASKSGATKFTILNNGGLQANNFTANGGVLYTNGSGVFGQTAAGTSSQCLLGGTTPTFGTCVAYDLYWNQTAGALYPNNSTVDFFVGGQATTSAKFAVLNVNSGVPVASVSAGTNGAAYLTADGKLATTAKQTLTLGDTTTTGNIVMTAGTGITSSAGNSVAITGGAGGATTGAGGAVTITGGATTAGTSTPSTLSLVGGAGNSTGLGGDVSIFSGAAGSSNGAASGTINIGGVARSNGQRAGNVNITGDTSGSNASGNGGAITLLGGQPGAQAANGVNGGNIGITGGAGNNSSGNIHHGGAITIAGGAGNSVAGANGGAISITTGAGGTTSGNSGALTLATGTFTSGSFGTISVKQGTNTRLFVDANGNLGVGGQTSPLAALDVKALTGTTPAASISAVSSFAALLTDNSGVGDLFTASKSGATKFSVLNNGNVQINNFTSNGGVIYTNASGVLAQATAGTSAQCLLGGTTPTFGSCATGTSDAYWNQQSGSLFANNSTVDFFIGGQATTSAKFAVLNVNSGTPVATIAGNISLGAASGTTRTIGAAAMNPLQLGDATTGDLIFAPANTTAVTIKNGGNVGIGTTAPAAALHVSGNIGITNSNWLRLADSGGTLRNVIGTDGVNQGQLFIQQPTSTSNTIFRTSGNSEFARFDTSGNLGIANTIPLAKLDVTGSASLSANEYYRGAGTAHLVNILDNGTLNFQRSPGGDAGLATELFINSNGNIGIGNTTPGATLDITGSLKASSTITFSTFTSNGGPLYTNGSGAVTQVTAGTSSQCLLGGTTPAFGSCATGTSDFYWNQANGTLFTNNTTVDLLVGGQATTSAKFAVLNVNSGTPVASVSSGLNGTAAFLTADGTLATQNRINLTIGNSSTYNTTGSVLINPNGTGNVGIGTSAPTSGYKLDVIGSVRSTGTFQSFASAAFNAQAANPSLTLNDTSGNSYSILSTAGRLKFNFDDSATPVGYLNTTGFYPGNQTTNYISGTSTGIGIDTTGPVAILDVIGTPAGVGIQRLGMSSTDTGTAPTTVLTSNYLQIGGREFGASSYRLIGFGYNDKAANVVSPAYIGYVETAATSYTKGDLVFLTRNSTTGTTVPLERVRIDSNGNVGIGTTTPIATLDVRGNLGTGTAASISAVSSFAAAIVDNSGVGDLFTASKSGATKFVIANNGNVGIGNTIPGATLDITGSLKNSGAVTFSNFNANNNVLYATVSTGLLAGASTNSTSLCLMSGASAPAWNTCPGSGGIDTFWNQTAGALYPNNSTVDFLVGSQATTSAKFAVLNVNSGVPVASVSAGTNGAAYLTADGKLATTAKQPLVLGDSTTTGDVNITPSGNVGIGNTSPGAKLDLTGSLKTSSTVTFSTFTSNGGPLYTNGSGAVAQTTAGTSSQCLLGGPTPAFGYCGTGVTFDLFWNQSAGALFANNSTVDLLIGGQSTTSAKFAFMNVNSGNPTASISGNLSLSAPTTAGANTFNLLNNSTLNFQRSPGGDAALTTQLFLNNNGNIGIGTTNPLAALDIRGNIGTTPIASISGVSSFAALVTDNSGVGDLFTASKSGATKFVIKNTGNVGIGTSLPAALLDVSGLGGVYGTNLKDLFRITNSDTTATNNAANMTFVANRNGNVPTPLASISGILTNNGGTTYTGALAFSAADAAAVPTEIMRAFWTSGSTRVGIGVTNPTRNLEVFASAGVGGTIAASTFTDVTQSYFLTPASATTSMIVAGNVGIGTTAASARLDVQGSGGITGSNLKDLFRITNTDTTAINNTTNMSFLANRTGNVATTIASISAVLVDITGDTYRSALTFSNINASLISSLRTSTEVMRLSENGYMGIGTTAPTTSLTVNGNMSGATGAYYTTGGGGSQGSASGFTSPTYISGAVGVDGFPIYSMKISSGLYVGRCLSTICNGSAAVAVDTSAANVGSYTSIAIGRDGLPVISYQDVTNGDLKVTKCGRVDCTASNTTTIVDNSAAAVGLYTSIAIGTDGLPIISYNDSTNGDLKVVHCGNTSCSSSNTTTTLDTSAASVGLYTSITIGTDGFGVIAYQDSTNGDLKVIKCGNVNCSSGNTTSTLDTSSAGYNTSLAIDSDGMPVISYTNGSGHLKIAKCSTASCSSFSSTTIETNNAHDTAIVLGPDGLPVVGYNDTTSGGDIKVVKCGNVACSSGNTVTTVQTDGSTSSSSYVELINMTTSVPEIAYNNNSSGIGFYRCGNLSCSGSGTVLGNGIQLGGFMANPRSFSTPLQNVNTYAISNPTTFANLSFFTAGAERMSLSPTGNLGIGNTAPAVALDVVGTIRGKATTANDLVLQDGAGNNAFRSVRTTGWADNVTAQFFQAGSSTDNIAFTALNGTVMNRLQFSSSATQISASAFGSTPAPTGIFSVINSSANAIITALDGGNVGIGTTAPIELLHVNGNIKIDAQTNTLTALASKTQTEPGQIASGGTSLIASVSASAVYNGSLYVGTGRGSASPAGGAEVYRYNGGTSWTVVSQSTPGTISAAGGATTAIASVSAMTVFNGQLYVGTAKTANAEVYRYDGGTTWTKVSQPTSGTIAPGGNSAIDAVTSMAVYNGELFVGTKKNQQANIYSYQGNGAWTAINTTNGQLNATAGTAIDGIASMAVYNGGLYVGTLKGAAAQVWRYNGATGASVFTIASGTAGTICGATLQQEVSKLTVYNGSLIAGVSSDRGPTLNSAEVCRFEYNPTAVSTTWTRISNGAGTIRNGGTGSINAIRSMTVYNGRLYVGTSEPNSAQIYQYIDGTDWILLNTTPGRLAAAGTQNIDTVSTMIPYNNVLYAGTSEDSPTVTTAAEVYSYTNITDQSFALKFHAASQWGQSGAGGGGATEQAGFPNDASIWYEASPSGQLNGAGGNGSLMFSHGIITNAGAYDVAEDYPTRDSELTPGDLIVVDPYENGFVKRSNAPYDNTVLGVYSENPGFRLSQKDASIDGAQTVPVALAGRVPVRVSTENGPIKPGDFLTSSSTPGVAMKATKTGSIVGKAMAPYDGEGIGKIIIYVTNSWYDPDVKLTDTGNLNIQAEPVLSEAPGMETASSSALMDAFKLVDQTTGEVVTKIGSFAQIATGSLRAGFIQTQKIAAGSLTLTSENITIAGQSLKNYILATISEAMSNGTLQSGNAGFTSPIASIEQLHTNLISPLASGSGTLAIRLSTNDATSKLEIQNASGSAVASIDANGDIAARNASLSGNLAANGIQTQNASVSGTLRAGRIIADQIEGLNVSAATVSASYITNIYQNSASESGLLSSLGTLTGELQIASFSSELANITQVNATFGTFNQGLIALGPTSLADTSISGQLSIGGSMILGENSINTLGADLEIQPLKQGGISIMAGLIHIDTDGNVKFGGKAEFDKDVKINGVLTAGFISPIPDSDLVINLPASLNPNTNLADASKFVIKNASASAVFSVNQVGDVVASGSGFFNKLNLNPVQQAIALSPTQLIATGSAGIATISAQQSQVTIQNGLVTDKSLIYITPVGTPSAQIPYLLRQNPNESFTVGGSSKTTFNWLIIN